MMCGWLLMFAWWRDPFGWGSLPKCLVPFPVVVLEQLVCFCGLPICLMSFVWWRVCSLSQQSMLLFHAWLQLLVKMLVRGYDCNCSQSRLEGDLSLWYCRFLGLKEAASLSARLVFMYVYSHIALMFVQGSLFPLRLFKGVVPFAFCSARLSCLWFVQGSLFPLPGYVCIFVLLASSLFIFYYHSYIWSKIIIIIIITIIIQNKIMIL